MLIACNIGHESALEAGDPLHYTPPRIIRQMRSALWSLPLWAKPTWIDAETWWVHPFSECRSPYLTDRELCHIAGAGREAQYSHLILWGHERSLAQRLTRLYHIDYSDELNELPKSLMPCWTREASVQFFRRYSTVLWSHRIQMIRQGEDWAEILQDGTYLLKLPYSSSGRGICRLEHSDHQVTQLLRKYHAILAEPLLDKVQDYGAEYYIDREGEVHLLGLCAFDTDGQGHYIESLCQDPNKTAQQLSASLTNPNELPQALSQQLSYLTHAVAPYYHGAVGIDMLTYRSKEGIALHPWVEINLRYTMGHYALDLYRERIPQGSTAEYRFGIVSAQRASSLLTTRQKPVLDSNGRLLTGVLPLTATELSTVSHIAYLRCCSVE